MTDWPLVQNISLRVRGRRQPSQELQLLPQRTDMLIQLSSLAPDLLSRSEVELNSRVPKNSLG